jgi:3-oxoacyl-[acyl-carrier-protein] synthase-3
MKITWFIVRDNFRVVTGAGPGPALLKEVSSVMKGVKITGIGTYLPARVVDNDELSLDLQRRGEKIQGDHQRKKEAWSTAVNLLDGDARELARDQLARSEKVLQDFAENAAQFETSDKWIRKRTGIIKRHVAAENENVSDLAAAASLNALAMAGLTPQDIDFIALGTVSSENWTSPPTASRIQDKLGIKIHLDQGLKQVMIFDLEAACTTFPTVLSLGYSLVSSGVAGRGLVIGADIMTRTMDYDSRNTCILFGDAACCMVLESCPEEQSSFLGPQGFFFGSDGAHADTIVVPAGGTAEELTAESHWNPFNKRNKIIMHGRAVYEDIVPLVANRVIPETVAKAGLTSDDIDFIVLHQANMKMNQAIEKRLQKAGYQSIIYHAIADYANTTSATQGLALYDAHMEGVLKPGMLVLDCAFGGGYTWGSALFRWPELPR